MHFFDFTEKLSPVVKGYPTEMLKIQESLKDWPAINVENRKLLRERYVEKLLPNLMKIHSSLIAPVRRAPVFLKGSLVICYGPFQC